MKAGIHPELFDTKVKCSCGNEFTLRTSEKDLRVDVCFKCHPFYTGESKHAERGGMVDRFKKRYGVQN